ncbi:MAG TPA: hypothetical protein VKR38_04665 [Usitatibacter sp.]|nr:hypothetical protein [Usitatibacter sp.]
MGQHRLRIAIALAALALKAACAGAATIVPVGVIGNAGEAGGTLFVTDGSPESYSGCAIDDSSTLWLSGGSSILRVGLDGRVLSRIPVQPRGSYVDGTTFALAGDILYFVGRDPRGEYSLYSANVPGGTAATRVTAFPHLGLNSRDAMRIAAQPRGRSVLVAYQAPAAQGITIAEFDPAAGALRPLGEVAGMRPESIILDTGNEAILVGGRVLSDNGKFLAGVAFLRAGSLAATKTAPALQLVATPTSFLGRVSLAGEHLWDTSDHFGFIARLGADYSRVPGVVMRWSHGIDQPTQVISIAPKVVAIATSQPGNNYLARMEGDELALTGRIGSLPSITNVMLSPGGLIAVANGGRESWWRWEDGSSAAPRFTDMSVARGTGFFSGDKLVAFGDVQAKNAASSLVPLVFSSASSARNYAERPTGGEAIPGIRQPCCVTQVGASEFRISTLLLDAATGELQRMEFARPSMAPVAGTLAPVSVEGVKFSAPTGLVTLGDRRLLVADAGRIVTLVPQGDGYKLQSTWNNAGGPGGALGSRVFVSAENDAILVSDSDKHRILWIDPATHAIRAQFGETGVAGNDLVHLDRPTSISVAGNRAVVADTGNQRVMKLELRP